MSVDSQGTNGNGIETLPKISIAWVGCTNVTDSQTDGRWHIANVNVSLRSLKTKLTQIYFL